MAQKHQVPLVLLLIVGYPTETREDYEFTKQWFKDRVNVYGNNNPVCGINLAPLAILDGTGLDKKSNELKLDRGENINIWINRETKISQDERAEYYKELFQICQPFNPPSGATLHSYENTVGTVA
jgi:radical SAM superfamily enzyme